MTPDDRRVIIPCEVCNRKHRHGMNEVVLTAGRPFVIHYVCQHRKAQNGRRKVSDPFALRLLDAGVEVVLPDTAPVIL